ncbi:MAG: acetaldehyde dehydrogenase (acetylating) [Kangiellaceae bacterium]|nr:acetaldehyde dehydrogenase (acetylating) [Kangiellaceae bacterium]
MKTKVAIIGSGNIGTDLMIKIIRQSNALEMVALVGIEPNSEGLARAERLGIPNTSQGIDGLLAMEHFADIAIVFDATSAAAHQHHNKVLQAFNKVLIDLTPAAIGPYVVPVVNADEFLNELNINMVTCGGQATIPIVAAISSVASVTYAEIVASISSKSAGPGTRANIDEFTETTSKALEVVGRAKKGKAIIVLNPAEPPMNMRDTVMCLSENCDQNAVTEAVTKMVAQVNQYVPGYRLKQAVQFEIFDNKQPLIIPGIGRFTGLKSTVFLEVEGAAHFLPSYAGNLDIMTSAALSTAERVAQTRLEV